MSGEEVSQEGEIDETAITDSEEPKPEGTSPFKRFLIWYLKAIIATGVCIVVLVGVWFWGGIRPVGFGLILGMVSAVLIYMAIKVYYAHILVVSKGKQDSQLEIRLIHIPLDLMPEVEISGSVGYARDNYGRQLMILKEFDKERLCGSATWAAGLTDLHFAARWDLVDVVLKEMTKNIRKYGEAKVRAVADLMKDRDRIARLADEALKLDRALSLNQEANFDESIRTKRRDP